MNDEKSPYTDILAIVTGFTIIGLITGYPWFAYVSLAIGVVALLNPIAANLVSKFWRHGAKLLGKLNGSILLGLFYILIIIPFSLINRAKLGKTNGWINSEDKDEDFNKPW